MKAELLREKIEAGFAVGRPTDCSLSATGEPYVALFGLGGEGAAFEAFLEYANDRRGTLYWRVTPEIEGCADEEAFYMRLLISEQPAKVDA